LSRSRPLNEGTPLSLIEAMANGKRGDFDGGRRRRRFGRREKIAAEKFTDLRARRKNL
jgi:hypothetical protein